MIRSSEWRSVKMPLGWLRNFTLSLLVLPLATCWDSVDSEPVDNFTKSWYKVALEFQQKLQLDTPINKANFLYSHNAYNAEAYQQFGNIRYQFPNHKYSIKDQLRMGIRMVELDVHWYLGTKFKKELLLCHGQSNHTGCVVWDRPYREGLEEIRDWLDNEAGPHDVIVLLMEEYLDGNEEEFLNITREYLGDLIFQPQGNDGPSGKGPSNTFREVLDAGKRVIIMGHTSAASHGGEWGDWVYDKFLDGGAINDFEGYPECDSAANRQRYNTKFVRYSSDATNYLGFYDGEKETGVVQPEQVPELLKCDVNALGFDMVEPAHTQAAVWSWQENQPDNMEDGQNCAAMGNNGFWTDEDCAAEKHFACRGENQGDWKVTTGTGTWTRGNQLCYLEFGSGYTFSVPTNGYQNNKIVEARNEADVDGGIWLNYHDRQEEGDWVAGHDSLYQSDDLPAYLTNALVQFSGDSVVGVDHTELNAWADSLAGILLEGAEASLPEFVLGGVNGRPAIELDGGDSLSSAGNSLLKDSSGLAANSVAIVFQDSGGQTGIYWDGDAQARAGISVASDGTLTVSHQTNGRLAELIIYGVTLTAGDQSAAQCALEARYGIASGSCN